MKAKFRYFTLKVLPVAVDNVPPGAWVQPMARHHSEEAQLGAVGPSEA
jgi:hypothetical protein